MVLHTNTSSEDDFKYKIDNPSMVTRNLMNILFSEKFADVILICADEEVNPKLQESSQSNVEIHGKRGDDHQ